MSMGNKVQATAFAGDIAGLDARLQLYSTYLISNVYVKPLNDLRFCVDHNYQYVWSFTRRTFIQDTDPETGVDFRQDAENSAKPFSELFACHLTDQKFNTLFPHISFTNLSHHPWCSLTVVYAWQVCWP
ncbi:unnamed protein product [Cuscuta epithymum]|uniref:Uncharacterized protein n=1 Tax=Cuscuta epithymum TaxID=186058 RepID=A0AAV0E9C9_9ASTE|nr:unnamed protein product [Cuscuta epithymum]